MLQRYVRRLVCDRDGAADVLQETCLRILASESVPIEPAIFAGWCCGVARNVAARHRRQQRRSPGTVTRSDDLPNHDAAHTSADHRVYLVECLARVRSHMDADALELFVRHYVFEERICDLAAERAQSPASLRMRLMRIRSAMRGVRD